MEGSHRARFGRLVERRINWYVIWRGYSKGPLLRRLSISYSSSITRGARQPITARGLGVHSGGFHVIAWHRNPLVVAVREAWVLS
jgi:hypothetical protein